MDVGMRSLLGWFRRRLGGPAIAAGRGRKRPARVPSACESLEQRQVLSTATFSPFATLANEVAPPVPSAVNVVATPTTLTTTSAGTAVSYSAYASPAVSAATSVVAPASIGVTSTTSPAYYYGQATVQAPGAVQASSVAPVGYAGQPVVAVSSSGLSAIAADTDYVQDLYRTVLDRVGSPTEVAAWVDQMSLGVTVPQVAEHFVNSIEHRQDEVDTYYQEFLHRTPDAIAADWVDALLDGASEESVVEGILDSTEYQSAHVDPAEFVQGLYTDVLGRPADSAGYAGYEGELAAGETRQEVVASIVQSSEAIDQVLENYYENYLHRQPDLSGSAEWAGVLESPGGSASNVAVGILSSPEFVQDSQQA